MEPCSDLNLPPIKPIITGPKIGKVGIPYTYTFKSVDLDEDQISYYIDWGDGSITEWTGFQPSSDSYIESHIWTMKGIYTIKGKAKDIYGYESSWGTLDIIITRDKAVTSNMLLLRLMERFPLLQQLLDVWRSLIE